ncbi:hypothetical protein ABPG72_004076 [Tetrahymena utriculariae]
MSLEQQITGSILMIRPIDFIYNEQTAVDNEFMNKNSEAETTEQIRQGAISEFDNSVEILKKNGINVIVFDKSRTNELDANVTPDAVFPNNWISTEPNGKVILYPMFAKNRDAEKNQFRFIIEQLLEQFQVNQVQNFQHNGQILEGTGSLIIDRVKRRAYCNISQRANPEIFQKWAQENGYEGIMFESRSSVSGKPFYHTNILMSIAQKFAVVCKSCIVGEKAEEVVAKLSEDREVIIISEQQTEKSLCGNILQVRNQAGDKTFTVMSETAFKGYTEEQLAIFRKYGEIIALPIPTIERIGGGSARCMLAEINLPQKKN